MDKEVRASFNKLKAYCEKEKFKGYDPYDSLNSPILNVIPFISKLSLVRLAWTQFFKRAPINLRAVIGVKKEYNPKGIGLFLSGYCNIYLKDQQQEYLDTIVHLVQIIKQKENKNWSGACWGYNFDWQARAFFQPKNTPTVVATSFIGNALLDAYEITKDENALLLANSACNFILKDLQRTYDENGDFAFSYSPLDKSVVFNASLLGSRLLSRVYSFTKNEQFINAAKKSVNFCCNHQRPDGSWGYGTLNFHQWVDNFHTGYNLECIADYMKYSGDNSYTKHLDSGFKYYINTFFTIEGISKYYNNSIYPIDIHAPAQMVITLIKLNQFNEHKELINNVLNWTIKNMQSPQGYFYYQINKYFSSKVSYIRWAQAWMFYAQSAYLLQT